MIKRFFAFAVIALATFTPAQADTSTDKIILGESVFVTQVPDDYEFVESCEQYLDFSRLSEDEIAEIEVVCIKAKPNKSLENVENWIEAELDKQGWEFYFGEGSGLTYLKHSHRDCYFELGIGAMDLSTDGMDDLIDAESSEVELAFAMVLGNEFICDPDNYVYPGPFREIAEEIESEAKQ